MEQIKPDFGIICRHKDKESSNLSTVFDSYGCSTLEAKVAVVDDPIVEKLMEISKDQRLYGTLALKTESANRALSGRHSRTRNRELKVVNIAGETILAAGPERERSPVDGDQLDEDLDEYMKEAARLKEQKRNGGLMFERRNVESMMTDMVVEPKREPRENKKSVPVKTEESVDDMDEDLEAYMREAARLKEQKRRLVEQTDRAAAMMEMEEYDDTNDSL